MDRKVGVVGLGYVGLPVAIAFGKHQQVIGFDINEERIEELKNGFDRTKEVSGESFKETDVLFTSDYSTLTHADFIIISVATPINNHNQPDLEPLLKASTSVGSILKKGDIVVYESTVFPGATEEECLPVLEANSGLVGGEDFFVGYSPERINPGDKIHTFENILKVVSGQTEEIREIIADVYSTVVTAGVYRAESIKVAESAKLIENIQRDVNIALMNELAVILDKVGVDTKEVLETAGTKWNFLKFYPGLVGGHCIGVDPYYLTYKAEELGTYPEFILASRRINDSISKHIALSVLQQMIEKGLVIRGATINILGLTFKENTPDLRNTKVVDLIEILEKYGMNIVVHDAEADKAEAKTLYDIELVDKEWLTETDVLIFAVGHDEYKENIKEYMGHLSDNGIVVDIKGIIEPSELSGYQSIWRL